jgi:hypothetical protein
MDTAIQLGSIGIILGAPIANSSGLLNFSPLDNLGLRLALILLVLGATKLSPLTAILTMLAVFSLFMERNFTVLAKLPNQQPHFPDSRQGIPSKAESLPAIQMSPSTITDEQDGLAIADTHDSSTTEKYFEEASDLQDSNPRLPEGPSNDKAVSFYESKQLV